MSVVSRALDRLTGGRMTRSEFDHRFARYAATGAWESGDGESLLAAFLESGGPWLTEASSQVAANGVSYDFDAAVDTLGLWHEPGSFDRALASLRADGYALCDVLMPDAMVDELSGYFATAPCTLTSDRPTGLAPGETVPVDFENPLAEKYAVTTKATLASPTVRALMLDQGLLRIAQAYLGSAPIIDILIAWYSFPAPDASREAGQLYHFDLDRIRWLKAFLLLSDQDEETGAHMYVPGTQRDKGIDASLLRKGYARLQDDEVARYHPRDTWKTMTGRRGVVLLEDTRGLHKGMPLTRDHRLMLQFEYAQSMFGHPAGLASVELDPVDDPYWHQMRERYPLVLTNFER